MTEKTGISLRNFFIYNCRFGPKEGEEEEKLLFYYPDTDIDTKIKNVGLCEAIVKFTNTFTSVDDCTHVRTQKTAQLYYQPEPDYWMIMTVNVPFEKKDRNGTEYNEYKSGEVHVKIIRELLRQSYLMFRLFLGTFAMNVAAVKSPEKPDTVHLKEKLEQFYSKYLLTLRLQSCDIVNACRSIQYLPLEKLLFLRVHNFIEMIEATFPFVTSCIFLYNEQVVWSEVNQSDLYSIYEYLNGAIFPKTSQYELRGGSITRSYSLDSPHYGSFITGPEYFENCINVPKIFIFNGDEHKVFNLVIYRALNATICLFIEDDWAIANETYIELHSFIGPQLTNIASDIGENFLSQPIVSNGNESCASGAGGAPRFLFINELSFQHTGTIHLNEQRPGCVAASQARLPGDVMNLIADLHVEDAGGAARCKETVLKTHNDFWIVKRANNWRHFYVIVNKCSTLLEITEDAKRLFDEHTKNMFFCKK